MAEENPDEQYDPSEHTANEVKDELKTADEEEKLRIAALEQAGKNRSSVIAAADIPEGVRLDSTGRRMNPWEVLPEAPEATEEA